MISLPSLFSLSPLFPAPLLNLAMPLHRKPQIRAECTVIRGGGERAGPVKDELAVFNRCYDLKSEVSYIPDR